MSVKTQIYNTGCHLFRANRQADRIHQEKQEFVNMVQSNTDEIIVF